MEIKTFIVTELKSTLDYNYREGVDFRGLYHNNTTFATNHLKKS